MMKTMEIDNSKFEESINHIVELLHELLTLMKARNRLNGEIVYDNQDLCVLLKLSKRSLQRLRSLGLLPYMQIGQKTFYLESDIMDYIQKQKQNKKNFPDRRDDETREGD